MKEFSHSKIGIWRLHEELIRRSLVVCFQSESEDGKYRKISNLTWLHQIKGITNWHEECPRDLGGYIRSDFSRKHHMYLELSVSKNSWFLRMDDDDDSLFELRWIHIISCHRNAKLRYVVRATENWRNYSCVNILGIETRWRMSIGECLCCNIDGMKSSSLRLSDFVVGVPLSDEETITIRYSKNLIRRVFFDVLEKRLSKRLSFWLW